ncbi:MAG TPA: hypothetical protein VHX65_02090 [Pirellulales bacterium]|jgi:hypothetical protein|nr:hypothetical protein [Pirellulales bacterium]
MPRARQRIRNAGLVLLGGILGSAACAALSNWQRAARGAAEPKKQAPTLASLAADTELLKAKATDQSHVMMDVSFQFANVWFAGQHANWDLADFFLGETDEHLHWAVRVIPVRKDSAGKEVILKDILQAIDNSPMKQLKAAVKAKDKVAFEKAYRFMLEGCYSCHKAVSKPYLHPQIPTEPATPIINFDPNPDWPK